MKAIDKIKAVFIAAFTAINGWLGVLAVPFYFLLLTNVLDYGTGIAAAACRGERVTSLKGFKGIVKKVCMWLLVLVGAIIDYMIIAMGQTLHIEIGFENVFALVVIFWLMANELISILENIHDIGVPLPPFLLKIVKYLKGKTEDVVETVLPEETEVKEE